MDDSLDEILAGELVLMTVVLMVSMKDVKKVDLMDVKSVVLMGFQWGDSLVDDLVSK